MASKGLGPLPSTRGSALTHGCGRDGRVVLPVAGAAAVSTGVTLRPAQVAHDHGGRRVGGGRRLVRGRGRGREG